MIAVPIPDATSPEPTLHSTLIHSVNTLSIIQEVTHTKNTNIYLLNLTSNLSTWQITMPKFFTTALFPETAKLKMSSMGYTIECYVRHKSQLMGPGLTTISSVISEMSL